MDDLFIVAQILRPHGRRGEVVVRPLTDHLPTLTEAERFFLGPEPGEPVEVLRIRMHKGLPLISLGGIDTIDKAQSLRGKVLCLPRGELRPLEEGEFFLHDLEGLTLQDHEGNIVGKISHILQTGGPPLLAGKKPGGKEFFVPFASGTISEVDLEAGTIRLTRLPGLVNGDTE